MATATLRRRKKRAAAAPPNIPSVWLIMTQRVISDAERAPAMYGALVRELRRLASDEVAKRAKGAAR